MFLNNTLRPYFVKIYTFGSNRVKFFSVDLDGKAVTMYSYKQTFSKILFFEFSHGSS